ncbi:helix-turn-helix domain-containing protein [Nocardiopsis tropica]|uniref:Helix-turn-helix domain-containing protein n=1 Tax=Nocardiopsis tropica TaxID=109330 RepID=A0ABU7KIY8_9ACTN|nr:helix-turn-helix domain-containing protein [Nocardiopsis umidischolae]MEE2049265.1 helix-turn-helix domain-containing protein [Nocardiopsis umidischolae]
MTAARVLGIGRIKAYELARADELPVHVVRVGGLYRITTSDLLRFIHAYWACGGRPRIINSVHAGIACRRLRCRLVPDLNGRGHSVASAVTVDRRSGTAKGMCRISPEHALNWSNGWAIQDSNL